MGRPVRRRSLGGDPGRAPDQRQERSGPRSLRSAASSPVRPPGRLHPAGHQHSRRAGTYFDDHRDRQKARQSRFLAIGHQQPVCLQPGDQPHAHTGAQHDRQALDGDRSNCQTISPNRSTVTRGATARVWPTKPTNRPNCSSCKTPAHGTCYELLAYFSQRPSDPEGRPANHLKGIRLPCSSLRSNPGLARQASQTVRAFCGS